MKSALTIQRLGRCKKPSFVFPVCEYHRNPTMRNDVPRSFEYPRTQLGRAIVIGIQYNKYPPTITTFCRG